MKKFIVLLCTAILCNSMLVCAKDKQVNTGTYNTDIELSQTASDSVTVHDLGNDVVVYEYVVDSDPLSKLASPFSVNAKSASKYYNYTVSNTTVLSVKYSANFSYGHTDGIVRVTNPSYTVISQSSAVTIKQIFTSTSNGNPGYVKLTCNFNYNGTTVSGGGKLYCNNNGNTY